MATKLIDMKMKNTAKKAPGGIMATIMGGRDVNDGYPMGLTLSMNEAEIKKLKLEDDDLQVGQTVDFQITAKITDASMSPDGKGIKRCSMQIIKMAEMEDDNDEDDQDGGESDNDEDDTAQPASKTKQAANKYMQAMSKYDTEPGGVVKA